MGVSSVQRVTTARRATRRTLARVHAAAPTRRDARVRRRPRRTIVACMRARACRIVAASVARGFFVDEASSASRAIRGRISSARAMSSTSRFADVPEAPKDPILGITELFLADSHPEKMNLGVGAYRDDNGKPVVLKCVREAERRIAGNMNMEYLPTNGLKDFVQHSIKLAYGEDSEHVKNGSIAAVQSLSGTGSCRLLAEFQRRFMPGCKVYISVPTWSNHHNIWRDAGCEQDTYRYYKESTRGLDFEGLIEDIEKAPNGSMFLMHACAHNPTGVDPTAEQWAAISKAMKTKGHFAFFDMAYQGFASGDCVRDAQAVRIFVEDGHKIALAQSFAKNMGLYGQRIGTVSVMCADQAEAVRVESQLKVIARAMYSNPPNHGALLAATVLGDEALKAQWYVEVKEMADRIINMRTLLRKHLEESGSTLPWQHVTDQIGMFCYSGMTGEQVDRLRLEHHIYMTRNGRISMAGVTSGNVERLAKAIHEVTK